MSKITRVVTLLDNVGFDTAPVRSSNAMSIEGAEVVTIFLTGTGITSGSGSFQVEISNDGTNWATYNKLIQNLTSINGTANERLVDGINITSDSSDILTIKDEAVRYLRIFGTFLTDGSYTATVATLESLI